MKIRVKENSFNIKMLKISKNGQMENDKKLLIRKLALNNLSHLNISEDKNEKGKQKEIFKIRNTISSLKKVSKNFINTSLIIKKRKQSVENKNIILYQKIKDEKIKKINNISTLNSSNIIKEFQKMRKMSKLNKTSADNKFFNKNKSFAHLPFKKLINNNIKLSNSLSKNKKNNNEGRNKKNFVNSFKTTATNSYKDIKLNKIAANSSNDSSWVLPPNMKFLEKNRKNNYIKKKNKDKLHNIANMTSLLNDVKNQKIKNKEQSYKIFNDNISIKNNLYKDINKFKGNTNVNSTNKNNILIF